MGSVVINKERCKGCELCMQFCTKKLLKLSDDLNSKGYHYCEFPDGSEAECNGCTVCAVMCPDVAVEVYK